MNLNSEKRKETICTEQYNNKELFFKNQNQIDMKFTGIIINKERCDTFN